MVDISTHLSLFNIFFCQGGAKDGYAKYISCDFGLHQVLQSAKYIIYAPINAIEDVYVTLGHFVKIKMASKMADSRFMMEMSYFSRFAVDLDLHFSDNG